MELFEVKWLSGAILLVLLLSTRSSFSRLIGSQILDWFMKGEP